ncbi:hypothetical protein HU200_045743 [Digitaria exilis]|uniref:Uncharacterized protein n=1 Tax=Digitaria exilis TaxID=1010633 RepID=A0A835EEB9_9POAL|nr:hypothetical protein HU200_045743 [Digitaria exilis]
MQRYGSRILKATQLYRYVTTAVKTHTAAGLAVHIFLLQIKCGFCVASAVTFYLLLGGVRCISMFGLRIQDHFTYLGVDMEADDWSTCRIITTQSVEQFRKELASNIMMTKHNVEVSIVEPSIQTDRSSF